MPLLLLSDLHLDEVTDRQHLERLAEAIREADKSADMMIIVGDLAENAIQNWPKALRWLGRPASPQRSAASRPRSSGTDGRHR
jgi:3',5'-cyclic AMP phosphodiesterase CpdA